MRNPMGQFAVLDEGGRQGQADQIGRQDRFAAGMTLARPTEEQQHHGSA